ncbi:hypothetical protein M8994_08220 [Brucella sp. 21LCYQ03]|nr:hypothetical protein [Brucella sp. 21LCYQ03]
MANEPENTVADQISELRSQLSNLSSQLADRLGTASDKADNALSSASSAFDDVAANARYHGERVLQAARENPGAATATLATVGVIGVLAGIMLGRCRR